MLLAFTLGAAAPGAGGDSRQGRSSAIRTLEKLTVPSGLKGGAVVKSKTQLRRGKTYRLIASEAIRQSKTDVTGRTVTYELDPLYCFQTTDPAFGGNCSLAVPVYSPRLEVALPPSTTPVSSFDVATPGSSRPPFSRDHRYQAVFKAAASGPIYARVEPVPSVQEDSYSGAYKLEIRGEAPPKKKARKKKKKPPAGCRARRKRRSGRAAAECQVFALWNVNHQSDARFGVAPGDATGSRGRLYFKDEDYPQEGRYTTGEARTRFDLSHRYVLRGPGGAIANEITVDLQTGSYRYGGGRRDLHLRGVVLSTERPVGIAVGDRVGVSLHDLPDRDRLTITVVSSNGRVVHFREENDPPERLKLKVDRPIYCVNVECAGIRG
jgi:hypothetical protein